MAVFKCKMCGGDIHAVMGSAFGTCDSCQTTSTLPRANDERIVNLFNRANNFRRLNEFDKAMNTYDNILNEDGNNAEAYWGVVLSRYGIEYVQDPVSHQRIPTCHRVQGTPVLSDPDYLAALENAPDSYTRSLYEEEARKISEIQKGILAISRLEEPYDVFICYKETTDGGSRTQDSVLAQDIYYQLHNEGYRVFFARLTLEDKLGQEYEPYIFAALNSAKVMLVVGTKPEHFNAVWVKNEWSRYLALMKKDRSRLLIPCYRDMDAYDMPGEFSHLQSQDMSKIGFVQDLIRGVRKVLQKDSSAKGSEITSSTAPVAPGVDSLLKRGQQFLEDGTWQQAREYFERVLDIDPECAQAHIGNLCVALNVRNESQLVNVENPLTEYGDFNKAMRFADARYRARLEGYNQEIESEIREKERLDHERRELEELERRKHEEDELRSKYDEAVRLARHAKSLKELKNISGMFSSLGDYQDAPSLAVAYDDKVRYYLPRELKRLRKRNLPRAWFSEIVAIISIISFFVFLGISFVAEDADRAYRAGCEFDRSVAITEVYLEMVGFVSGMVVIHFLLFALCIYSKKEGLRIVSSGFLWAFGLVAIFMFGAVILDRRLNNYELYAGLVAGITATATIAAVIFIGKMYICKLCGGKLSWGWGKCKECKNKHIMY